MKKFIFALTVSLWIVGSVAAQGGTAPAPGATPAATPATVTVTHMTAILAMAATAIVGWVLRHYGIIAPTQAAAPGVAAANGIVTSKPIMSALKSSALALVGELEDDDPQLGNILKLFTPTSTTPSLADTQASVAHLQALAPLVSQLSSAMSTPTPPAKPAA